MYKELKFELKHVDEIRTDIQKARDLYGARRSIFLADSDNLVHHDLPEIVSLTRETFPEAERVTAYARARTLLNRKEAFLSEVRKAGLDRLHMGLESGDAVVLERLQKGVTPDEIIRAGQRAKKAGFELSFYILCGAGGVDRWRDHALGSARVCNEVGADFLRLRTLTILAGTPLYEKRKKGGFSLTGHLERLKEVRLFIENLDLESSFLASDHMTNYLWADDSVFYSGVSGSLPEDREDMLEVLDRAISFVESTDLEIRDTNQLYEEGIITSL